MGVVKLSKLMTLEWKKLKHKMVFSELIIYWLILMFLPVFFIKMVSADFGQSFDLTFELIQSIQLGFVLFGASLINQIFIEEYKNKTISLSFGYPISRKKLFMAKVLFISLFVFLTTIISFLLTGMATYLIDLVFPIVNYQLTGTDMITYFSGMIVRTLIVIMISFIPLFVFAIWKRATVPTVLCAIFCMQLPNFSTVFNLNQDVLIAVLSILGVISLYLSIKTADKVGEI
jgi:ABC-type transport system involved in multi-copper enzyme maturation permease subunit